MISKLIFRSGKCPEGANTIADVTPVTILIGPNNSGKSHALSEIDRILTQGHSTMHAPLTKIISDIEFTPLTAEQAQAACAWLYQRAHKRESKDNNLVVYARGQRFDIHTPTLLSTLIDPNKNKTNLSRYYFTCCTLKLDGYNRTTLLQQQQAGNLQEIPTLSLQVLFRQDDKRYKLRKIIQEAFGSHLIIDPTDLGQFKVRLSPRAPRDINEERGITEDSIEFHAAAPLIEEFSDGVRAFTGIMAEVLAGEPKAIIIDEPEAFLHPSLALKLGSELSNAANAENKQLFVSTHSENFLMGCIQSDSSPSVVRLTYKGGMATSRMLSSERIRELMRDPLLRSSNVLSGLFYDCVIVTESDSDRAFYQEINERLQRFKPEWSIPNTLFINGHNWQSIKTLIAPLRELGIPAVGIMDFDVLTQNGKPWIDIQSSFGIPEELNRSLGEARRLVADAQGRTGKKLKQHGGTKALEKGEKVAVEILIQQLASFGLFIVPGGELESWLPELECTGHGPNWLIKVFEKMGHDSSISGYVKPAEEDVWQFIHRIKQWTDNPDRLGLC